jgi:hypothetical protein
MKTQISNLKRGNLIEVNKNFPYYKTLKNKQGRITKVNKSGMSFNAKLDGEVLEVQKGEFELIVEQSEIPKSLYLVPWIETESGLLGKPEGYKVFETLEECINGTKKDNQDEECYYSGIYFGPVRPLCYYETPYDKKLANMSFVNELPKFVSLLTKIV